MGLLTLEELRREFRRPKVTTDSSIQPSMHHQQQNHDHAEGNSIENLGYNRVLRMLEHYKSKDIKLDVPEFDGKKLEPGVFIDWLHQVEKELDYNDVNDPNRVKLVKAKLLVGDALRWWDRIQSSRDSTNYHTQKITTWDEMRRILKREFVPSDYEMKLYLSVLNLKQKPGQCAADYTEEFFLLTIRAEWSDETEENKVWRYLNGLNKSIQSKLEFKDIFDIPKAVQYAFKVEKELQQKQSHSINNVSASSNGGVLKIYPGFISDECNEEFNCSEKKKVEYFDEYPEESEFEDYLGVPAASSKGVVKIYPGFISDESGEESDCPKKVEYYDDFGEESDSEEYFSGFASLEDDFVHVPFITPADSGKPMPWESSLIGSPSPKENTSGCPVFFTRCTSGGKLWDTVISSSACYNFISYDMVIELNLKKQPIREPFQTQGALTNGAEIFVYEYCLVAFSIGPKYKDEVPCFVIPTSSCHLLLGKNWQYERNATYSAADNTYSFDYNRDKIVLTSLPCSTQLNFTVSRKIIYD